MIKIGLHLDLNRKTTAEGRTCSDAGIYSNHVPTYLLYNFISILSWKCLLAKIAGSPSHVQIYDLKCIEYTEHLIVGIKIDS